MATPVHSTWPTASAVPTTAAVMGAGSTETVRAERVAYGKGPIAERRPAFGVPEGTLACAIKPSSPNARNYGLYEHSMDEYVVRYMAIFLNYPDLRPRDRLIWLNVGGTGIDKTLTVMVVDYNAVEFTWNAHCEEHAN